MKLSEMTPEQKSRWITEKLRQIDDGPYLHEYSVRAVGLHDPAMTVILLKELLRCRDYECIISQDEVEMGWRHPGNNSGHSYMISLINNTLEEGVADAFMLANGFEEET